MANKSEKIFLAGPWIGEFGWELFCWQGYVRNIARDYGKIIVISRTGNHKLYEDFCHEYVEYNTPSNLSPNCDGCVGITDREINDVVKNIKHDTWIKPHNIGLVFDGNGVMSGGAEYTNQKFIKYESNTLDKTYDIIIHPRNRIHDKRRNWNQDNWNKLVELLGKEHSIVCVGGIESHTINGVDNYKNHALTDIVALMNRCKLVVSPVSGPIHLAALSGAPYLTWGEKRNELQCKKYWNPFNVKTNYMVTNDKYNPTPEEVYNNIKEMLK
jgi:hypothetical protein